MNPNYLTRAQLADFGRNTAAQVANGKVSGLIGAQIASIAAAIDAACLELAEADRQQVETRAAAIEATRTAEDRRAYVLKLLQDLKYLMKSLQSAAHEFDAVGFDPPVLGRRPVIPLVPFELAATGYSNGVNLLRFNSNNLSGRVTYIFEAKIADSPSYVMIGTSKARSFKHTGVRPGVAIQYRVRAQAARGVISNCSNEAAVYRE